MEHDWVVMTTEPVDVVAGSDGKPLVFDRIPHQPAPAMYGCRRCYEPLESAWGTLCKPAKEEKE